MTRFLFALALLLPLGASLAQADTIVLKDGGRYEGRITAENKDSVTLKHELLGVLHVARTKIRYILRDAPVKQPETPPIVPPPEDPPTTDPTPDGRPPALPLGALTGEAVDLLAAYRKEIAKLHRNSLDLDLVRSYLKKLTRLADKATPALARALADEKDWRMRLLAVRALVPLKDPAAIPVLTTALGDPFLGGWATSASRSVDKYIIRGYAVKALRAFGHKGEAQLRRMAVARNTPNQIHAVNGLRMLDVKDRAQVLIPVARDKLLSAEVRNAALKGLVKQGRDAHLAMADLLPDEALREAAAQGLKFSKDKGVISKLFGYVREAAKDDALAQAAAVAIGWTDQSWRPSDLRDHVDFLLLRASPRMLREELAEHALPRLRTWAASQNEGMRGRARRALATYP